MAAPKILVATEAFSTDVLGYPRAVAKGETFREGHVITESHPAGFEEWAVDNEFERATAAPGEKRARRPKSPAKQDDTSEKTTAADNAS